MNARRQREGRRMLDEHFVDVHEPFKKAIIKEGIEGASKFINRINLEAGASARANMIIKEAQEKIFGKGFKTMSENQQRFLSRIENNIQPDRKYTKTEIKVEFMIPNYVADWALNGLIKKGVIGKESDGRATRYFKK